MLKWILGTPPKIGSEWNFFDASNDPWRKVPDVIIEDVKDGWVRYRWGWAKPGTWLNTKTIRSFRLVYSEVKP